jgi:predicted AlkP superfamily pyrophosphatase or phosphodiesterase
MINHIIVLDVVGLEFEYLNSVFLPNINTIADKGEYSKTQPVFPAVTSPVQASLLSGRYPSEHGIIGNGFYDRINYNVYYWEQASGLVKVDRIWDIMKKQNRKSSFKSAVLFWQNTMYSLADIIVTPKPIHLENGMVQWCYSKPVGFYDNILKPNLGGFNIGTYWGPFASSKSSEWIVRAAEYTLELERPNLMLVYIPHVDYSAQRYGKNSPEVKSDLKLADDLVGRIVDRTLKLGIRDNTQFIILSEYGFSDVSMSISLNLKLRDAGLTETRKIDDREYMDYEFSKAFAMVDHQIAHVYVKPDYINRTRRVLEDLEGISSVLVGEEQKSNLGINHERSGEIVAIADRDRWFNYYWWYESTSAPSFAGTVDIHRKPGYDPVELFMDTKTKSIPLNASLVKSSHGRPADPDTGQGILLYASDRKGMKSKNKTKDDNHFIPNSAEIGEHLIKLVMQ